MAIVDSEGEQLNISYTSFCQFKAFMLSALSCHFIHVISVVVHAEIYATIGLQSVTFGHVEIHSLRPRVAVYL